MVLIKSQRMDFFVRRDGKGVAISQGLTVISISLRNKRYSRESEANTSASYQIQGKLNRMEYPC